MTKAKGKVRVDKDVQIVGDSTLAFFIMPGEALALLHDELEAVVGTGSSHCSHIRSIPFNNHESRGIIFPIIIIVTEGKRNNIQIKVWDILNFKCKGF